MDRGKVRRAAGLSQRRAAPWLLGAAAAITALACAPDAGELASRRPHIVLALIDTLRADHVGAYGYERNTTPFIDRLARNGQRFENVISQSS